MTHLEKEARRIFSMGIKGFKFSSFTQRFDLESSAADEMLSVVEHAGALFGIKPVAVFDTFVKADAYFGADPNHLTTPRKLAQAAERHQALRIVAAHMGGLTAEFQEIATYLKPRENLYLDTSNAAHTLSKDEFISLLLIHGPERILFGTDWPWFHYREEIPLIRGLCSSAGFRDDQIQMIMGGNAAALFLS